MNNYIGVAIVTVIFSAFFSGIEIAFVSANKLKIELDKKNKLFSGKILSTFRNNPSAFISTMLLGNTIALVLYGIAMTHVLEPIIGGFIPISFRSGFLVMVLQTILSTLLILFVAEFAPKVLFRINPNKMLKLLILPLTALYYILFPVQFVFVKLSEFLLKYIFRVKFSHNQYEFNYSDLDHYIREYSVAASDTEHFNPEIQMFQNAMDFAQIKIRECMIPRNEITAVEESESIDILTEKFISSGHSKILIYRQNIDNIIGYVHSFDMFSSPRNIKSIKKPVLIVPESMPAKETLRMFINQHKSLAVVVDEFGGTSGMVALEDLIEEITGEINDEFDEPDLLEKVISEVEYIFSGRLEIDYLNNKYQLNIPAENDYETLAGYIISITERIPEPKEKIMIPPFEITILKASNNRIDQVGIKIVGEK
ncbi:MAG: hemolysin family protein [Bacteroidota bacterium]